MDKYIKVKIIDNEMEAQLLEGILQERNVPHHMKSYHSDAYDGLFQFQQGWGAIYAPEEYRQEILEIIADLRK